MKPIKQLKILLIITLSVILLAFVFMFIAYLIYENAESKSYTELAKTCVLVSTADALNGYYQDHGFYPQKEAANTYLNSLRPDELCSEKVYERLGGEKGIASDRIYVKLSGNHASVQFRDKPIVIKLYEGKSELE